MNWLTKIKTFSDKIKKDLQKKFPTKEEKFILNYKTTKVDIYPILLK